MEFIHPIHPLYALISHSASSSSHPYSRSNPFRYLFIPFCVESMVRNQRIHPFRQQQKQHLRPAKNLKPLHNFSISLNRSIHSLKGHRPYCRKSAPYYEDRRIVGVVYDPRLGKALVSSGLIRALPALFRGPPRGLKSPRGPPRPRSPPRKPPSPRPLPPR